MANTGVPSSASIDALAKWLNLLEKSGMTPELMNRVSNRPILRQEIVALIRDDMLPQWQPVYGRPLLNTFNERLQVALSEAGLSLPHGSTFDATQLFDEAANEVSPFMDRYELALKLFDGIANLYFGLSIQVPATVERIASFTQRAPRTVSKRLKRELETAANRLCSWSLSGNYTGSRSTQLNGLKAAGLVPEDWAISQLLKEEREYFKQYIAAGKADDKGFDSIDLSVPAQRLLSAALNTLTIGQLRRLTADQFVTIRATSPVIAEEIIEKMTTYGLTFAPVSTD
ncbi:MAG: hypothetical protein JWN38_518 [Candidatus Saccharibacteria bacterium]|nr:hypothetical protein [Candidatus Saccharibacteria bacterium]